jgi:hypothetical protein
MRKSLIAALVAAVSLAAPALSSAQVGNTNCTGNGTMYGTVTSNVTVPAGATCVLYGATLQKNIDVYGTLKTFGPIHFMGNVNVHPGGSFAASNWPVTIDKDLSITDPAANSGNGFWGSYTPDDQSQDHPWLHLNEVKGSIIYTIDQNYPLYQSPYLDFAGGVKVDGDFTYNTGGRMTQSPGDGLIAAPVAMGNLITLGTTTIS